VGNERERCQTGLSSLGRGVTRLEDIQAGTSVRGISPQGFAKVFGVEWYGDHDLLGEYCHLLGLLLGARDDQLVVGEVVLVTASGRLL
jgi:hypothetical protein